MTAKSRWWFCGECGFKNHPRLEQDSKKCEQCGAAADHPQAVDYIPAETR
jgi:NADH pyrophosphatase NudC (nudix superfamily)